MSGVTTSHVRGDHLVRSNMSGATTLHVRCDHLGRSNMLCLYPRGLVCNNFSPRSVKLVPIVWSHRHIYNMSLVRAGPTKLLERNRVTAGEPHPSSRRRRLRSISSAARTTRSSESNSVCKRHDSCSSSQIIISLLGWICSFCTKKIPFATLHRTRHVVRFPCAWLVPCKY